MKALRQGARMRRIFRLLLSWILLSPAAPLVLAVPEHNLLPTEVFSNSRLTLKNGEVKEAQGYLFTRVDLKPAPSESKSTLEAQASLFALKNFAVYSSGALVWDQLRSESERAIALSLYQRATRKQTTVKGLTPIQKTAHSNMLAFIYAANAPANEEDRIHEREIVDGIREALRRTPERIDFLSYLELSLRNSELFDPKPVVKGLAHRFGEDFPLFLLGLDVANPESLIGQEITDSIDASLTDRYEIALLLGKMPYQPALSVRLSELLLSESHEETAKLAVAGSVRLSKSGPAYERAINLSRHLNADLTGAYVHPVPAILPKRVADESTKAGIALPSCYRAIHESLGDLPLAAERRDVALFQDESITEPAGFQLEDSLDRLRLNTNCCRNPEHLGLVGDLFQGKVGIGGRG